MLTQDLSPTELRREPELAVLAVLDASLAASRMALIAEHPDADDFHIACNVPTPPLTVVAALLVDRTVELRSLISRYTLALDDFRAAERNRDSDIPF